MVADALIAALREGVEDLFPDATARTVHERLLREGKAVERELMVPPG